MRNPPTGKVIARNRIPFHSPILPVHYFRAESYFGAFSLTFILPYAKITHGPVGPTRTSSFAEMWHYAIRILFSAVLSNRSTNFTPNFDSAFFNSASNPARKCAEEVIFKVVSQRMFSTLHASCLKVYFTCWLGLQGLLIPPIGRKLYAGKFHFPSSSSPPIGFHTRR